MELAKSRSPSRVSFKDPFEENEQRRSPRPAPKSQPPPEPEPEEEPEPEPMQKRNQRRRRSAAYLESLKSEEERARREEVESAMEQFNSLLAGLSLLHDDSQLHWVYSLALESLSSGEELKVLAEALHQRWLSDPAFPPDGAKIALYFADLELEDLKFSSLIFAIVMGDYRDRLNMRMTSRAIFTNSVHYLFQFYFAFRHRGPVFKALVDCLFESLHLLLDKEASETELLLLHRLFCLFGADLLALNFRETQEILLKLRHKIVDSELKPRIRGKLMELVDLSYAQFEFSHLTPEQQDFYARFHIRGPGLPDLIRPPAAAPTPRAPPKPSSRRESIIF